jgi:hypothetical protein
MKFPQAKEKPKLITFVFKQFKVVCETQLHDQPNITTFHLGWSLIVCGWPVQAQQINPLFLVIHRDTLSKETTATSPASTSALGCCSTYRGCSSTCSSPGSGCRSCSSKIGNSRNISYQLSLRCSSNNARPWTIRNLSTRCRKRKFTVPIKRRARGSDPTSPETSPRGDPAHVT